MSRPYTIRYKNSVKPDLRKLKQSNLTRGFDEVREVLCQDPYRPTQSFEKLQPYSAGRYSRRINNQHRVVYSVDDENRTVTIWSAWSHYQ